MTISDSNIHISYIGDAITKDFIFNMKILDTSWIVIYEDEAVSSATIVIKLNSSQDNSPGGTVNIDPAPTSGTIVDIVREVPEDQLTEFSAYSGFPAEVFEDGLDKLTIISQQSSQGISRSIRQNPLEDARNMELPDTVDRALRLLMFDQDGGVSVSSLLGVQVDLEAGSETLVAGTIDISFAEAKVDSTYIVTLGGSVNETFWYSAKTINGFTITSSNAASTADVDWMALS